MEGDAIRSIGNKNDKNIGMKEDSVETIAKAGILKIQQIVIVTKTGIKIYKNSTQHQQEAETCMHKTQK